MQPHIQVQQEGDEIFVFVNSVRIAKRGEPGTAHARTWVSLEPGWEVNGLSVLHISYTQPAVH